MASSGCAVTGSSAAGSAGASAGGSTGASTGSSVDASEVLSAEFFASPVTASVSSLWSDSSLCVCAPSFLPAAGAFFAFEGVCARSSAFPVGFLAAGFATFVGLGGLFTSTLSCALLAELAVGRVILARKPSSTGLVLALLTRDLGRSLFDCDESDGREDCLLRLEAVGVEVRGDAVLSVFRVDDFRVRPDEGVAARLGDWEAVPFFAAEDAVGAVMEAGRRTGRVGDLDRDFVAGEAWAEVVPVRSREGVEARVGLSVIFAAGFKDGRLGFLVAVLAGSFAASFVVVGLLD